MCVFWGVATARFLHPVNGWPAAATLGCAKGRSRQENMKEAREVAVGLPKVGLLLGPSPVTVGQSVQPGVLCCFLGQ